MDDSTEISSSRDSFQNRGFDTRWYEERIPLRGYYLELSQIKAVYRDLQDINNSEGDRIISSLRKPDGVSEEDFRARCESDRKTAFRITTSIIGYDGKTEYGETEDIFDSKNLPFPIARIFFTNNSAFQRVANGNLPPNSFALWIDFSKPPLFDPIPFVSAPTENGSEFHIKAQDTAFFYAAKNAVSSKFNQGKKWYSFIHNKFIYDIGLWFIALPYILYFSSNIVTKNVKYTGENILFIISLYLYIVGICLLIYRFMTGYLKWAFPVNVLSENKDQSAIHRILFWGLTSGLVIAGIKTLPAWLWHGIQP